MGRAQLYTMIQPHRLALLPALLRRPYASLATIPPSSSKLPPSTTASRSTSEAPRPPRQSKRAASHAFLLGPAPPPLPPTDPSRAEDKVLRAKPRTPGTRHLVRPLHAHLHAGRAHLPLTFALGGQARAGRNRHGRVTVRHRGGGHKRRARAVDFARAEPGEQVVMRVERDPGRSGHVALLRHERTGALSYVLAAQGMRAGDRVASFMAGVPRALLDEMGGRVDRGVLAARTCRRGNCLPLRLVPAGTQVYNVGTRPGFGGVFCRSAGTYATVVGRDESERAFRFVVVRLQSGEVRRVSKDACASIGVVSNPMWGQRQLGKAGRARWLGRRPTVRGVAMNACELSFGRP
jgi:ribosomal protein L2